MRLALLFGIAAAASLLTWAVATAATLRLARVANRQRPVELRDDRLASARISDSFRRTERSQWLPEAAVVAASFVFAATEFSLLFSLLFWGALTFYEAVVSVRASWAKRSEEREVLGPPTSRTYFWLGRYAVLSFSSAGAWIAAYVCVGAALAHLLVI